MPGRKRLHTFIAMSLAIMAGLLWAGPGLTGDSTQLQRSGSQRFTNSLGMEFVKIPGRAYWVQTSEVTQAQWAALMKSNPSHFTGDSKRPVERVNFQDAQEFIKRLNQKEGTSKYRLPTEEEWLHAANAGQPSPFRSDQDYGPMGVFAWNCTNSGKTTHTVGTRRPNAWGLYDMYGNVWEWTSDCFRGNCAERTIAGGSWECVAVGRLAGVRGRVWPKYKSASLGFRVLMDK